MIYNTKQKQVKHCRYFREICLSECILKLGDYCNEHKPVGGTWKLADKIKN